MPATTSTSWPRRCCPAASSSTESAAPPTFNRAIACTILIRRARSGRRPRARRRRPARRWRPAAFRRRTLRRPVRRSTLRARRRAATRATRGRGAPSASAGSSERDEQPEQGDAARKAELVQHLVECLLRDELPVCAREVPGRLVAEATACVREIPGERLRRQIPVPARSEQGMVDEDPAADVREDQPLAPARCVLARGATPACRTTTGENRDRRTGSSACRL